VRQRIDMGRSDIRIGLEVGGRIEARRGLAALRSADRVEMPQRIDTLHVLVHRWRDP